MTRSVSPHRVQGIKTFHDIRLIKIIALESGDSANAKTFLIIQYRKCRDQRHENTFISWIIKKMNPNECFKTAVNHRQWQSRAKSYKIYISPKLLTYAS